MIVSLPLSVQVSKKTKFILNLNNYRNAHYLTLNNAKIRFKKEIMDQIEPLPVMGRIKLTFTLFPGSMREMDVSNVCSIQDKFFCDALVEAGKVQDDNYKILPNVRYLFGEVDRTNPRVDVEIEEIDPMQIILNQADLDAAVQKYVRSQINIAEDTEVSVTFSGQVSKELSATLSIGPAAAEPPKRRRRTKAQIEADNAAAAAAQNADEAPEEEEEEEEVEETSAETPEPEQEEAPEEAPQEAEEPAADTSASSRRSIFDKAGDTSASSRGSIFDKAGA